jgi:hypothetical protein
LPTKALLSQRDAVVKAALTRPKSDGEEGIKDGENVEDDDEEVAEVDRPANKDDRSDGRRRWTTR